MKAARIYGARDMRIVDLPIPDLEPGQALCRVVRCGVCGTDSSIYTAEASFVKKGLVPFPMTPGHEWSGVVEAVGSDDGEPRVGDRVVGDGVVSCGACPSCLSGSYFECPKLRAVGTLKTWDGAYAEYIVMPRRHLFRMPAGVDFDNAAMTEPAANAYNAVRLSGVEPGETVLVHGTGPIGIMAVRIAKALGAARVLVTGRRPPKLEAARLMGADALIDTTHEEPRDAVRRLCGSRGVDRLIEASGSRELLRQSLSVVRPGGVISLLAFYENPVDGFDVDALIYGGITLRPVIGAAHGMVPVLRMMDAGMLDFRPLITGRYPLDEAPRALEDMENLRSSRIKLMLDVQPSAVLPGPSR